MKTKMLVLALAAAFVLPACSSTPKEETSTEVAQHDAAPVVTEDTATHDATAATAEESKPAAKSAKAVKGKKSKKKSSKRKS